MRRGLRQRAKQVVRDGCVRLAERLDHGHHLVLGYPPTASNTPRWGWGKPEHPQLAALLGRREAQYREVLESLSTHASDLLAVPLRRGAPGEPFWLSPWLPGFDAALLYTFIRERRPKRYVEVGSGVSTMFAVRAIRDGALDTRVTSIDPAPRAEVDALCDDAMRVPLELAALDTFDALAGDDVVFVDNSHRVFMNSDVVTFFFDVLPRLPDGVLVGVHDILLPADYVPEWRELWFSEQYLLGAMLLAEAPFIEPVLPAYYVSTRPALHAPVARLFQRPDLDDVERRGFSFWFRIRR